MSTSETLSSKLIQNMDIFVLLCPSHDICVRNPCELKYSTNGITFLSISIAELSQIRKQVEVNVLVFNALCTVSSDAKIEYICERWCVNIMCFEYLITMVLDQNSIIKLSHITAPFFGRLNNSICVIILVHQDIAQASVYDNRAAHQAVEVLLSYVP